MVGFINISGCHNAGIIRLFNPNSDCIRIALVFDGPLAETSIEALDINLSLNWRKRISILNSEDFTILHLILLLVLVVVVNTLDGNFLTNCNLILVLIPV